MTTSYRTFELQHNKTTKIACAPNEDSDQSVYPPNPIRVFAVRSLGNSMFLHADSEDSDHTGRIGHFVGFVMMRLIFRLRLLWCLA